MRHAIGYVIGRGLAVVMAVLLLGARAMFYAAGATWADTDAPATDVMPWDDSE